MYDKCPNCGSKQLQEGIIRASNAELYIYSKKKRKEWNDKVPLNSHLGASSTITAKYCTECGFILAAFVDEPNHLND
ncbi:PF20097 family protein [Gracilibacillus phocaeensis]|uniref:PF20097 family protein n=1 Tax=Gracilibacillus phocaeensis TaxID=2042304 RepID=UPI0010317FEF|nr:PF20097 family protein [Gracilibacillus phocaeensis]